MFAVIGCLPVLLILTGSCAARPLLSSHSCGPRRQSMPDLDALVLRNNPCVTAADHLIKGLYYSESPNEPNAMAAFYMAYDQVLEQNPFLVTDFRSRQFFLDTNRDSWSM